MPLRARRLLQLLMGAVLGMPAGWAQPGIERQTTLDAAPSELAPFARLVFEPPVFGQCDIRAAWLDRRVARTTRRLAGVALSDVLTDVTHITVVRNVPEFEGAPDRLRGVALPRAPLSFAATELTRWIDGERRWVWTGITAHPPPKVMDFSCGTRKARARVVPAR